MRSNARYYDPGLGRFVSADTIAPGKENPQNRNRYSYALNNPLIFVDPSGHCAEDASERENQRCYDAQRELEGLGLTIVELWDWQALHLEWILEAIGDLMQAGGWSVAKFKENMGIANGGTIDLIRGGANPDAVALATDSILGITNQSITFYDGIFAEGKDFAKYYTVHEFAHIWDNAQGGALSAGLQERTGGSGFIRDWPNGSCFLGPLCYQPGGSPASEYGGATAGEDWAETVAATVYPNFRNVTGPDPNRIHYGREKVGIPPPPPSRRNAQ